MGRLLAPDAELGPMFKSFRGRLYMNLSQMRRVVGIIGAPAADMLRSLGHPEEIRPEDELPRRAPLGEILRCLPDLLRIGGHESRRRNCSETRAGVERAGHDACGPEAGRRCPIARCGPSSPMWVAIAPAAIQIVFVMSGVLPRETSLRKACRCRRLFVRAPRLPAARRGPALGQLTAGVRSRRPRERRPAGRPCRRVPSEERRDVRATVRDRLAGTTFLDSFDRFLDAYGHRGRYESDWSLPRLHEDPAPALFAIRSHLQTPPNAS